MARIREKIREARAGLYTDDEVEELTALKLQAFADEAEIDPELLARSCAPITTEHLGRLPHRDSPLGFWGRGIRPGEEAGGALRAPLHGPPALRQPRSTSTALLCHNLVREMVASSSTRPRSGTGSSAWRRSSARYATTDVGTRASGGA